MRPASTLSHVTEQSLVSVEGPYTYTSGTPQSRPSDRARIRLALHNQQAVHFQRQQFLYMAAFQRIVTREPWRVVPMSIVRAARFRRQ